MDNLWITFFHTCFRAVAETFRGREKNTPCRRGNPAAFESYPQVINRLSTGYPQLAREALARPAGPFGKNKDELSTKRALPVIINLYIN